MKKRNQRDSPSSFSFGLIKDSPGRIVEFVNQLKSGRAIKNLAQNLFTTLPQKPMVLKFPKRTSIMGFEAMDATQLSVVDRFFA